MKKQIIHIDISKIIPDENQPRKYFDIEKLRILKDSIKKYGVINPITVSKQDNKFILIDGERRYRACVELGLKQIPCIEQHTNSRAERLIQQFHIQEQREGWTPTEKAIAMRDIAKEMNIPYSQLGELLGINYSTLSSYRDFVSLIEHKYFQKNELTIDYSKKIKGVKNFIKRKFNEESKSITKEQESKIEKLLINGIKKEVLIKSSSFAKLKDCFDSSSKLIDDFIEEKKSIEQIISIKGVQGSYAFRNVLNNIKYLGTNINVYITYKKDHIITESEKSAIKNAIELLKRLI